MRTISRDPKGRWTRHWTRVVAVGAGMAMLLAPALAAAHPPCCVEDVNPHGQTIPPAGLTTSPGTNPNSGQNDDGFFLVGTTDGKGGACGSGTGSFILRDTGSLFEFGTFTSPLVVKYTEANGATPGSKKIGSDNGEAGAVEFHLNGTGDLQVCSLDTNTCVTCLVSPPPR